MLRQVQLCCASRSRPFGCWIDCVEVAIFTMSVFIDVIRWIEHHWLDGTEGRTRVSSLPLCHGGNNGWQGNFRPLSLGCPWPRCLLAGDHNIVPTSCAAAIAFRRTQRATFGGHTKPSARMRTPSSSKGSSSPRKFTRPSWSELHRTQIHVPPPPTAAGLTGSCGFSSSGTGGQLSLERYTKT